MYTITEQDHRADICILLSADSMEELFLAGLQGMADQIKRNGCNTDLYPLIQEEITVEGRDQTTLLINFLSEILTLSHTRHCLFCQCDFCFTAPLKFHALIKGKPIAEFDEDLKAVTYHEAQVHRDSDGRWTTKLIFDI